MSTFTHAVRIGPEFFAKAKNDYRDWKWAIAREFMQNCGDAPNCDYISVTIDDVGRDMAPWATKLVVENNGDPMSQEILTGKLLALGGSGKNCAGGAVGGFGKAKEVLYFLHEEYEIVTGGLRVRGSGAGYDLDTVEPILGTRSTVTLTDKLADQLAGHFRTFITLSQWRGTFVLKVNGKEEVIETRLCKGRGRKDMDFGRIYTNSDHANLMVVRIGGMPMFTRHVGYKGCVVLELNGKSSEVMQSSRDGLKWEFGNQLDNFVVELSTNKRSALRDNTPRIEKVRYAGHKLAGKATKQVSVHADGALKAGAAVRDGDRVMITMGGKEYDASTPQGHVAAALINLVRVTSVDGTKQQPTDLATRPLALRPEFVLKNDTGLKIPEWFTPDGFSDYSKRLIWRWMGCLVTLADVYGVTKPFSVGFIFTEEPVEAEWEKDAEGETIYVKAADVVRHPGRSPVIKAKWSLTGNAIWDLVSYAAHEFVHMLGYGTHDENYAGKLTEVLATCLRERTRLAKVFQSRVEWPDA